MIVYKFGGASIKNADAIKQMAKIVRSSNDNLIVVVSAMGKTTNQLEAITRRWFDGEPFDDLLQELIDYHQNIITELFDQHVPENLNSIYEDLYATLRRSPSLDFNYEYDQIVANGELISTKIIASYFNILNFSAHYIDVRKIIRTDRNFKQAGVIWSLTKRFALEQFTFENYRVYLTQGFIAGSTNNQTTTLGREGSDYSAALLASACGAQKLVVWKDVPGIMNADPVWFDKPEKIEALSYNEAIELTYYGAKVIHPKTIKPLQENNIPLIVNSFLKPEINGSYIGDVDDMQYNMPVYIRKQNQVLISIRPKTPAFVAETDISHIFSLLAKSHISVQLTQMSAVSFTICIDKQEDKFANFMKELHESYHIKYNDPAEIITIRNYSDKSLQKMKQKGEILIEQKTRRTAQIVKLINKKTVKY